MTEAVNFEGLPKRKLESLLAQGYEISGYSLQRTDPDGSIKRGAITTGGMVLWWHDDHPPVSLKPADPCPGCRPGVVCRTPSCGRLKQNIERKMFFGNRADSLLTSDEHEALTFHPLEETP